MKTILISVAVILVIGFAVFGFSETRNTPPVGLRATAIQPVGTVTLTGAPTMPGVAGAITPAPLGNQAVQNATRVYLTQ
jgi:hypothetical protein